MQARERAARGGGGRAVRRKGGGGGHEHAGAAGEDDGDAKGGEGAGEGANQGYVLLLVYYYVSCWEGACGYRGGGYIRIGGGDVRTRATRTDDTTPLIPYRLCDVRAGLAARGVWRGREPPDGVADVIHVGSEIRSVWPVSGGALKLLLMSPSQIL